MKGYLLPLWAMIDPIYFKCSRLTYPEKEKQTTSIFRVRLTKYKGKSVTLSDGSQINKNDTLLKIHLHNVRLLREIKDVQNEIIRGKIIYRYVKQSLPGLDAYIYTHKKSAEIKGIIGITLLNKGCHRLGFEVIPISHPIYKRFKWASCLLINAISHNNASCYDILKQPPPSYLFMSRERLTAIYRR